MEKGRQASSMSLPGYGSDGFTSCVFVQTQQSLFQ
jgi:hypothetical protein